MAREKRKSADSSGTLKSGNKRPGYFSPQVMKREAPYLVMMFIPVTFFLVFKYWPLFGLAIAFQDYQVGDPFISAESNWVGLKWFLRLVNNPFFWRYVRNTLMISLWDLVFSFPTGILLALLFNEIRSRKFRTFASNISLVPHFISTVVLVGMLSNMFSMNGGIVNNILGKFGVEPINFLQSSTWFRPLYTFSGVWQSAGYAAIVYTAAISGVDTTMFEAARVDGCTRVKMIWHITIPTIMPTVVTMFLLRIGGLMSVGYEKIILMYSPAIYNVADVFSTYAYRAGLISGDYSLSTAIGLFNGIVNLILLITANKITKKVSSMSLW